MSDLQKLDQHYLDPLISRKLLQLKNNAYIDT